METETIDTEQLAADLDASHVFLEACAKNQKINWRLPVIRRKLTVVEVLAQATQHISQYLPKEA